MANKDYPKPNGTFALNEEDETTFVPNLLPPKLYFDNEMIMLLAKATERLGQLKGVGPLLPNPHLLIRPYLQREAVLSSMIEGTLASMSDLFRYEALGDIDEEDVGRLRIKEVNNYVRALEINLKKIREGSDKLGINLIKNSHGILLEGVRGEDKRPGEFRETQNYVARIDGANTEIIYTPPALDHLVELLENFEEFLQTSSENIHELIQCAILHYQFEAIHPFGDGNGRIGRLLITLFLIERKILPEPLLYLSAYFEKNVEEYRKGLLAVSQKSKWREWVKFFLKGIIVQAEDAIEHTKTLITLQDKYRKILGDIQASANSFRLVEYLFANPYLTYSRAMHFMDVTFPTAKRNVDKLVELNILTEISTGERGKKFVAHEIEQSLLIQ